MSTSFALIWVLADFTISFSTSISAFFFFKLAVCLPLLRATISPSLPALCAVERERLRSGPQCGPGTPIALLTPLFRAMQGFISFPKSRLFIST